MITANKIEKTNDILNIIKNIYDIKDIGFEHYIKAMNNNLDHTDKIKNNIHPNPNKIIDNNNK